MKNKILKISVVILLIMTLTMTNFIFLGSSLISYAADNVSTNHKNIEFNAYFKNDDGQKTTILERTANMQEISLYLSIHVQTEGFFVGEVNISNANFDIVGSKSEYVRHISDNTIYLNQVDVGATEIEVKIKPIEKNVIDIGMFSCESELNLKGIYRDNTEKDIDIKATRTVNMQLVENMTNDNVKNEIKVITNKILKVSGEDKRVIQLSLNMGLNENTYPMKELNAKIHVPEINGKMPEIIKDVNLNTMSAYEYKYENGYVEITLKNNKTENNEILWKKQGQENVILTYIYDAEVELQDVEITSEEKIMLQNDKILTANVGNVILSNEETDSTIEVTASNSENHMYKGKLYSNIEKQYASQTVLDVNLANIEEYISVKEEPSRYVTNEGDTDSHIYYNKTVISKEDFDTIFGKEGIIEIYNENKELLTKITSNTEANEDGKIVIDYTEKEPKGIEIKTSQPITEGTIKFTHLKTIRESDIHTIKSANGIVTKIVYGYNHYSEEDRKEKEELYTIGIQAETQTNITLNETTTEAKLEVNRDTLSTVIANDIEMKLVLKTDEESKDLYKNPTFTIELPEQVENIEIHSINMLYEEELQIANYKVDGRYITIQMQGEQTEYKAQSVEGANIIINATIHINRTAIAKPEEIRVTYTNEKANAYSNNEGIGKISKGIEVVAPKDVTAINSIKALNIETVGEEETNRVSLQRGTEAKRVEVNFEVINNHEQNADNVHILGTFPTKTEKNTMHIAVVEGIHIENAKVYYTENQHATADLENMENGWKETITNPTAVKKYLIILDNIASRKSVSGSYKIEIPENLAYNQVATEGYEVTYTRGQARSQNTVKATTISMETGIGPKLENKLTATVAEEEVTPTMKVKAGEVITYKVQVSNVGSEKVNNIKVKAKIPEGTTLVKPVDNYEYTGASYYKEVEAKEYETTIEHLDVGEVTYVEYEVMVKADIKDEATIINTAEINYSDVVQKTEESHIVAESGNLRAMVKRVTDRKVDLYESGMVQYFAIIKNTSSETMNNVTIKTNKSENLQVSRLTLITGMGENEIPDSDLHKPSEESTSQTKTAKTNSKVNEDTSSQLIEYSDEINIGTLEPGEVKVLDYNMVIDKMPDNTINTINFSVLASDGSKQYRSNLWKDNVNSFDIDMTMEANTQNKYIKSGDSILYTIHVKNNSNSETSGLVIKDEIPSQLTIKRITKDGKEIKLSTNTVEFQDEISAKGETIIEIETIVNYSEARTEPETITNRAVASIYGEEVATTADLNHIIEADIIDDNKDPDGDGDDNNHNGEDEPNGNIANGKQMISGLAWYDENRNGKQDDKEKTLQNIKVKLLNVETNQLVKTSSGDILQTTTNEKGMYVFNNIPKGQYIVIFEYDTELYGLTTYKADGISNAQNSDVRLNELLIGDKKQEVPSTDMIRIDTENISDISIGLIELRNFDLKLDKYVSRILVQNSAGTTTREYNNATTAKIEVDAKQMKGSNVIIEYNIVVTNVGEVAGYARNIIDYMPKELQFNSELNKDWYEKNGKLHTASLSNDMINPGESKTIALTLTKTIGEDNLVTRNNAEIYEAYNDLGLEDGNSTPGNNAVGENDMGSADVIISIRTGGVVYMSIGVTIAIIVLAGIVAGIIVKRKNLKEED